MLGVVLDIPDWCGTRRHRQLKRTETGLVPSLVRTLRCRNPRASAELPPRPQTAGARYSKPKIDVMRPGLTAFSFVLLVSSKDHSNLVEDF